MSDRRTEAVGPADAADRLRDVALGRGVGTEADRLEAVALACRVLAIDPGMHPAALAAVLVHAASMAPNRKVACPADALLTLAECALAACLDAETGFAPSPWIAEVVARCERARHAGDA